MEFQQVELRANQSGFLVEGYFFTKHHKSLRCCGYRQVSKCPVRGYIDDDGKFHYKSSVVDGSGEPMNVSWHNHEPPNLPAVLTREKVRDAVRGLAYREKPIVEIVGSAKEEVSFFLLFT